MQNVAAQTADAEIDLLNDLDGLDPYRRPRPLVDELVQAVTAAVRARPLADADAKAIAGVLFIAATARELSPRQIAKLGKDVQEIVVKAGGDAPAAERVARAATAIASERTENRKRWYHVS